MAWASISPVASSTLASSSTTGWPGRPCPHRLGRRPCRRSPPGRRSAAVGVSRAAGAVADGRTVMSAGSGPQPAASAASSAAPVGVVSSTGESTPYTAIAARPAGRASPAPGSGSRPCAACDACPRPTATGLTCAPRRRRAPRARRTPRRRRRWRRARRPRGSGRRRAGCGATRPSTSARRSKTATGAVAAPEPGARPRRAAIGSRRSVAGGA